MKQYEKSITSQWGEDGVIEEIFNRIGTKNKICVDVGAWDGKHFSNTWALREKGWRRILIESDIERVMKGTYSELDIIISEKCESIDESVFIEEVPRDFDLLCIDIDGDDYYLFQDMVKYKPRVVVIEYNQTVPPHISIVQERGGSFGASLMALCDLAETKGYMLVHTTVTNAIFVIIEADSYTKFDIPDINTDWISYIVTGYNGKQYRIGQQAHKDNQGGKHERLITDVKYTEI